MESIVLVTGASRGIGRAIALELGQEGRCVCVNYLHHAEAAQEVVRQLQARGCRAMAVQADVADRAAVEQMIHTVEDAWGPVDLLVNNAGLASGFEHLDEGDPHDWERMIDTNVKGLLYVTRVVSGWMIRRGKGGHIVNLGSIAGTQAYENGAVYCASKHAVHALSQGMRMDFLSHGIKVIEIRPGMVDTEFSTVRFHGDKKRAAEVYRGVEPLTGDDIAGIVAWVVSLPPHVNINDIEVMPLQQANAYMTFRKQESETT